MQTLSHLSELLLRGDTEMELREGHVTAEANHGVLAANQGVPAAGRDWKQALPRSSKEELNRRPYT